MVPFTETEHAGKGPGFQLRMLSFRLVELGKMLRNLGKWIQSSGDGVASVMLKGTEGMGYILTLPHPRYGPCQVTSSLLASVSTSVDGESQYQALPPRDPMGIRYVERLE